MIKKEIFLILGAPGSGKTNQAILLANRLKLQHISWGKMIKSLNFLKKNPEIVKKILDINTSDYERSSLIALTLEVKLKRFLKRGGYTGIIIEGFPSSLIEAKMFEDLLTKYNLQIECLININTSLSVLEKRLKNRKFCPVCGRTYDDFIVSRKNNICDFDEIKLKNEKFNSKTFDNNFTQYVEDSVESYNYLKGISKHHFSVSGDEGEVITFSNIIFKYRNGHKDSFSVYQRKSSALLQTKYGTFIVYAYLSKIDYSYHLALVKGDIEGGRGVLTRVHSSCMTGDIFGSLRCDCGKQLHDAMKKINKVGKGLIIYLLQEGRGINIINKISAYSLQQIQGLDTVEANETAGFPSELRQYDAVFDIIKDLKVKSIKLLTNNPDKIIKLTDLGVVIEGVEPLEIKPNFYNKNYLYTKKTKMKHSLKSV